MNRRRVRGTIVPKIADHTVTTPLTQSAPRTVMMGHTATRLVPKGRDTPTVGTKNTADALELLGLPSGPAQRRPVSFFESQ